MNVPAHFKIETVLTVYAVDNRRTVSVNKCLIRLCYILSNHKLKPLIGSG